MPVLNNPKHELFAQELAKGKTQAEAYERAGYTPSEPNASRLTSNDKIQSRIKELQSRVAAKTETTTESLVKELEEARTLAAVTRQSAAMVQATIGKARLLGLIIEKKEDVTPRRSLSELDARIRQLTKRDLEGGTGRAVRGTGAKASRNETVPNVSGRGTA